ncbi:MAG: NPCBM/NEW2 domain-containing protein [Planctomycetota bacterium]
MTRATAVAGVASLLLLAVAASAGPELALVDGRSVDGVLLRADKEVAVVRSGTRDIRIPTLHVVSATLDTPRGTPSPDPYNLYLSGGDRLRGKIEGVAAGDSAAISLDSAAVKGLKVPLHRVTAVCVGTFFGQVQTNYRTLFEKQRVAGRDSIVVNRGSKPFSFRASVLEVRKNALIVRMGEEQRELPRDKVYGFVRRAPEQPAPEAGVVLVRVHTNDGGRITLPLEKITETTVEGGGAVIARKSVTRVEFTGGHIEHLSDMQPVSVEEVALFGKAPRWRRDGMVLGGRLRLGGQIYARGIGVQAKSKLEFALGRRWNRLYVLCGIDDAASREGAAIFRVVGDGKVLHEVKRRRGEAPAELRLDVSGVDRLVLEALPDASYTSDLCDWANARVYNDAGAPKER